MVRSHRPFGGRLLLLLLLGGAARATVFPAEPFNGLQLTWTVTGASVEVRGEHGDFTREQVVAGTVTAPEVALSITTSPLRGICNSAAGSFWAEVSAVLWAGGKRAVYHSKPPCEGVTGQDAKVDLGPATFTLRAPAPIAEAPGGFSVDLVLRNPRYGDRAVRLSGSLHSDRPCRVRLVRGSGSISGPGTEPAVSEYKAQGANFVWRSVGERLARSDLVVDRVVPLFIGDRLVTGPDTRALLEFPDGSRFLVKSDTELVLGNSGFWLRKGETAVTLRRQGRQFQVVTPSSVIGVLGTVFTVVVGPSGTQWYLDQGAVEVRGGQPASKLTLRPGQVVAVTPGKPLPAPRAMTVDERRARFEPLPPPSGTARPDLQGVWQSPEFGTLRLWQDGTRVWGTYDWDGGQIDGHLVEGRLLFWWWEKVTSGRGFEQAAADQCGDGELVLGPDGQSFEGRWRYSQEFGSGRPPTQRWTARRVGPLPSGSSFSPAPYHQPAKSLDWRVDEPLE